MKTIVLDKPGSFALTDTPLPAKPGPGEALVRVRRIGICGTDLHAFRGRQPFFSYPRILGHELGVEVVELGAGVTNLKPGDRCAVEPSVFCGKCIACRHGKTNCCVSLKVMGVHVDGGMREQVIVPAEKLHVSKSLALEQLALVETLAIGAHAVDRAKLQPGETILIIGAGPIGLSVLQFVPKGVRVIVMDVIESRLKFCREQMRVSDTVVAGEAALKRVGELTNGDNPTAVFDATGNAASMAGAFEFVAHGGRLIFVGLFQGDVTFHDPLFHRREMSILASRNSTPADFKRIIAMIERGEVDTRPWITHRASFDEMIGSFPTWLDPASGVIKAVVEC